MPTLALAGGTSASLGRAISTALLSDPKLDSWNAILLSRSSTRPLWLRAVDPDSTRTTIRAVEYQSTDALTAALHGVHTLVSVTSATDGSQAQLQIRLLDAAVAAGCKRFAPSAWAVGPQGWKNVSSLSWNNKGVREACRAATARGPIEVANFNPGCFMNYLGLGMYPEPGTDGEETRLQQMQGNAGYAPGEDEACQGLLRQGDLRDGSGAFLLGLASGIAELPVKADGSWPRISMTALRDVGRYVAASLVLPRWEEEMSMVGDTVTMGELLAQAEAVTGRKFDVSVVTREALEDRLEKLAPDDFMGRLWTEFKLAYLRDLEDEVVLRPVVNRLCPDVQPMSVQQYLETYWQNVK